MKIHTESYIIDEELYSAQEILIQYNIYYGMYSTAQKTDYKLSALIAQNNVRTLRKLILNHWSEEELTNHNSMLVAHIKSKSEEIEKLTKAMVELEFKD